MKLKESRSNYLGFTGDLVSMLSALHWQRLEYVLFLVRIEVEKPIHIFLQSCGFPGALGKEEQRRVGDAKTAIPPHTAPDVPELFLK